MTRYLDTFYKKGSLYISLYLYYIDIHVYFLFQVMILWFYS